MWVEGKCICENGYCSGGDKMKSWIPCNEQMPQREGIVLCWLYGDYHIGYIDKD